MAAKRDNLSWILLQILTFLTIAGRRKLTLAAFLPVAVTLAASTPSETSSPSASWVIDGLTVEKAKEILADNPAAPTGGIWGTTADGAEVAIIAGAPPGVMNSAGQHGWLIVALRPARPSIACGTVMGWFTPSAKTDSYDCTMFTRCNGAELTNPSRFTLRLNDNSHLSLIKVHDGLEIVAWKILPYMFRSFIRERHDRPRDLDGLIRLWPTDGSMPPFPRYL